MQLFDEIEKINISSPCAVALGTFDGVHRGHQAVISGAVNSIFPAAVLSINRPFLGFERSAPHILSNSAKAEIFKGMGVDYLADIPFKQLCELSPRQFVVKILNGCFNATQVFCGFNYRFGKNAAGNVDLLQSLCDECNIELIVQPPVVDGDSPVSSSRIRTAIENGYVDTAARLMGRPYFFDFTVEGGDKLGRKLGFPTINQRFPQEFICPKHGVYASTVKIDGITYSAVCNIGIRPTVMGKSLRAETFILNFSGDLYGKNIPVSLVKYLRPEIKFPSLDDLTNAIMKDAEVAKRIISERNESESD